MATITEYYGSGGKTTNSEAGTWFWWVNGSSSSSRYGRSRLKVAYDNSDTDGTANLTVTLQMARSNGDYGTHGTVAASLDGSSYSKSTYISGGCSKRSNASADSYIPNSYWTDICSKFINIDCYANGAFEQTIWVSASCQVDNMVLSGRSVKLYGNTSYWYTRNLSYELHSQGGDYGSVYATCNITDWGQDGATIYNSSHYSLTARLTSAAGTIHESDLISFSDNSQVKFSFDEFHKVNPDYDIYFYIKNNYNASYRFNSTAIAYYADIVPFTFPSGPDNVKITYTPSNEEPTIVSSYNLSWTENYWGSAPSGSTKSYRLRIYICNSSGVVTESIGYLYGDIKNGLTRQPIDNFNSYWFDVGTTNNIEISKTHWADTLAKIKVGDYLKIGVFSAVHYDGKDAWSGNGMYDVRSPDLIGPIQDDQAKVKLLDYNSQIVTGKVWVKDETGTWRKAKKIYVDTGTTSKNWEKSTNPTS